MNKWLRLLLSIAVSQLAGVIGGIATAGSVWYSTLILPSWQPAGWLFGPVWITLYTLIGIALYLVWEYRPARGWFAAHWFLNTAWSLLFFGLQRPLWALIDIVLLVGVIMGMISSFRRVSRPAAWLLVPYLFWVLFATALNTVIVVLNP